MLNSSQSLHEFINGPFCSPDTFENDIAMVKVSPPFRMNAKVRAADLAAESYKPSGEHSL